MIGPEKRIFEAALDLRCLRNKQQRTEEGASFRMPRPLKWTAKVQVGVIRVCGTAEFEENLLRNTEF